MRGDFSYQGQDKPKIKTSQGTGWVQWWTDQNEEGPIKGKH